MIARVVRCWEGEKRFTVILQEDGVQRQTSAFLWMPAQANLAHLALLAEGRRGLSSAPRFAVELAPPDAYGNHHIEAMEMLHEPHDLAAENRELMAQAHRQMETPKASETRVDTIAKLQWQVPLYQRLKF